MFAASKSARSAAAGDNKFNYVTLLLNGDGTNGKQNNTFLDSSSNAFTITRNGTPTQGSFSPYGSLWSNYFNGSSDSLTVTSNVANFGTGDFTVEAWVYLTGSGGGYPQLISAKNAVGPQFGFVGTTQVTFYDGTTGYTYSTGSSANQWAHVAFVRSSGTFKIYVNGVQVGSFTYTGAINLNSTMIGAYNNGTANGYFQGYISNLRVVNGTAVYTGAFTPSTTPLTAITNTSLLTCQSNRFRDASSNNFTITSSGTPSVQRFSPFEPSTSYTPAVNGGSGYFNGTTDWLSQASGTIGNFGTGDFTVEFWLYPFSTATNNIIDFRGTGGSGTSLRIAFGQSALGNANKIAAGWTADNQLNQSTTASINQWYHVAVVRSGSTATLYINGVSNATATDSTSIADNGLIVASYKGTTAYLNAYISDLRVVKGTAVYTAAFTPPTAPLTAVTNTSLLLNYTNAGISNAAAANDVTTVGDAQVSTTQVKYGTASMKFDGTGDYLTLVDSPNLQLMAGDFTIEGWIYLAANGVAYGIISKGTATTGWSVNVTLGNKLQFSYTLSNLTGATSLSASTWYHFAVVRSGTASGNLKVYLNGVADATSAGAVTDTFNQTSIMYIGADRIATSQLNGYIDDLRITKGHARYTATFTPPTAALPTF